MLGIASGCAAIDCQDDQCNAENDACFHLRTQCQHLHDKKALQIYFDEFKQNQTFKDQHVKFQTTALEIDIDYTRDTKFLPSERFQIFDQQAHVEASRRKYTKDLKHLLNHMGEQSMIIIAGHSLNFMRFAGAFNISRYESHKLENGEVVEFELQEIGDVINITLSPREKAIEEIKKLITDNLPASVGSNQQDCKNGAMRFVTYLHSQMEKYRPGKSLENLILKLLLKQLMKVCQLQSFLAENGNNAW